MLSAVEGGGDKVHGSANKKAVLRTWWSLGC